jgi:hypothetical protein
LGSITAAADAKWNSVTINSANTNTSLSLAGLEDGTYTLYTIDAAGNLSAASTNSLTVKTSVPATTVATAAFSNDTGSSATDFITSAASQTISGTLSANVAAGEKVQVSLDNGSTWANATTSVGSNTWSLGRPDTEWQQHPQSEGKRRCGQ